MHLDEKKIAESLVSDLIDELNHAVEEIGELKELNIKLSNALSKTLDFIKQNEPYDFDKKFKAEVALLKK